jgi:hypothetical protein
MDEILGAFNGIEMPSKCGLLDQDVDIESSDSKFVVDYFNGRKRKDVQ